MACRKNTKPEDSSGKKYPGVQTNEADKDRVNRRLVDQETKILNNNHHPVN